MSKFQIEKVETILLHNGQENFFVVSNYPSGKIDLAGYVSESIARIPTLYSNGMWRIKSLKNN